MTRTWRKEGEKKGKIIEEEITACAKRKRKSIVKEKRRRGNKIEGETTTVCAKARAESCDAHLAPATHHTCKMPQKFFVQYIWLGKVLQKIISDICCKES